MMLSIIRRKYSNLIKRFRHQRQKWLGEDGRFEYQKLYVNFEISPADRVLDIGFGDYPFFYATHLVDNSLSILEKYRLQGTNAGRKIAILADLNNLPFPDGSFDYVYCSHVLEHMEDPIKGCAEIMRVGKRGYIETPTFAKDALFSWAKGMHKWHVVGIRSILCFFEYSLRQLEGVRSPLWRDIILGENQHPLQTVFSQNNDIFNVIFPWTGSFTVFVYYLNGRVKTLKADHRIET